MQAFAPAMTVHTERRKKIRNRPRSLVYVELESANGGMMRDLSEEGFALRAVMPLRAGAKTQFAFSLDEFTRISGEGRIVWTKEDGRVAGVEFCGIPRGAREQIRSWLDRADEPTARKPRIRAIAIPEPPMREELPEEAHPTPSRVALPSVEPPKAAHSSEPESLPAAIPVPPPAHRFREETRFTLPRVALPSVEPPKTAHSSEPESLPAVMPVSPAVHQPEEEARFTLPRVALPSVEPPKTEPTSEQQVARVVVAKRAEVAEHAVTPTESATAPSPETQTELHDTSPETFPIAVLEPLPTESVIEPLPELQSESEVSEAVDSHSVSHFLTTRAIGVILLLTLIAGAVVYHREIGHALIWLGQIIAGPEEAPRPRSSVAEPPAQATPVPETTVPASSPGVSDSAAASSPQGDRAAASETQPAAASRVLEVPPILPATPPSSMKTPSAPLLQPASQQNRVPPPASSSGTATDNGQEEYQQAEQMLRNRSREEELPEAVRLLWLAVEKGNIGAEVTLAELYRRGQGVTKNCDQARILLTAAARKGSAEAREHLAELVREGCE